MLQELTFRKKDQLTNIFIATKGYGKEYICKIDLFENS